MENTSVLNKYVAHAGICSRRKATELIKQGMVTVNKSVITEPSYRVQLTDVVTVLGDTIKLQEKVYILLNKPKDYITTVSDERGRKTVMDLVDSSLRIYPVGRLDRSTTGLLLLTNDGAWTQQLAHPRYQIQKTYHVTLTQEIDIQDMDQLKQGIMLEDGRAKVDVISYIPSARRNEVKVMLHSGKYRVVRRMFEALGYEVKKLDRIGYGNLTKKGLLIGQWRYLHPHEIEKLHQG